MLNVTIHAQTLRKKAKCERHLCFLMEMGLHVSEGDPFIKDLSSLLKIRDLSSNSLIIANFAAKYIP